MIEKGNIKRLSYAKYIYEHGIIYLKNKNTIYNSLAILSFHDALELFLLVIADILSFTPPERSLMEYWAKANGKLPLKNEMGKLNRIRKDFKHHGILPSYDDCIESQRDLHTFFSDVTRDVLGLDFSTISISDLIEDGNILKHIKAAEKYIDENKYEESLSESAKAFAYIDNAARGDFFHSFLINQHYLDTKRLIPKLFSSGFTSTNNTLQSNFENILKSFNEVKKLTEQLVKETNSLLLGVDTFQYKRFKLLTPFVYADDSGRLHIGGMSSVYRNKINFNLKNALFCMHFVIDSAIRIQQNSLDLINPNFPKLIRVKVDQAIIYQMDKGSPTELGRVQIKEEHEVRGHQFPDLETKEWYWQIHYHGKDAFINVNDVEIIK